MFSLTAAAYTVTISRTSFERSSSTNTARLQSSIAESVTSTASRIAGKEWPAGTRTLKVDIAKQDAVAVVLAPHRPGAATRSPTGESRQCHRRQGFLSSQKMQKSHGGIVESHVMTRGATVDLPAGAMRRWIMIGGLYRGQVLPLPLRVGRQHAFREKTVSADVRRHIIIDEVVNCFPRHRLRAESSPRFHAYWASRVTGNLRHGSDGSRRLQTTRRRRCMPAGR